MLIFLFVIAKVNKEELGTEGLKRINVPIVQGEVVLGSQGKAFPEKMRREALLQHTSQSRMAQVSVI